MLATQTPDTPPDATDVKQRIKETLSESIKTLQKRYVWSDAVVTSEDGDANLLCCILEAIFIHGIKSKYIRSEVRSHCKRGDRGPLPQPFFWSLLKTVTHRDVIRELETLRFVGTDVGRCRAWLRLALNHGLLECYLVSLFREDSTLQAHYQPAALLLNLEERNVLLSYLQGLASLRFILSYKSAVLNEWTPTPLALAGLCPMSQSDALNLPLNGENPAISNPTRKESWDSVSQSSGSSDAVDVQSECPEVLAERGTSVLPRCRTALNSSNVSLDTTGSSQLSSSLSSDSLLQGQDRRSPAGEQLSSCDLDISPNVISSTKRPLKDMLTDFRENGHCSQDSMREDSFASSTGPDHFSETAIFTGSDSETQGPATPLPHLVHQAPKSMRPDLEPPAQPSPQKIHPNRFPSVLHSDTGMPSVGEPAERVHMRGIQENTQLTQKGREVESAAETRSQPPANVGPRHSNSILSRNMSSVSRSLSHCWISEDDIYKPHLEEVSDMDVLSTDANGLSTPTPEPKAPQLPPRVIHRRQIGLSNPFRGLLRLGHLERRGAMGLWHDYYCELSPFEFRLYLNAEDRTSYDNRSLVRCEDVRVTSPEGRFEVAFPGKRLYLRAANRDEAEDWVDRIVEAVNKCRPAPHLSEQWELLQPSDENGLEEPSFSSPSSAPSSPERGVSSTDTGTGRWQQGPPPPEELDWTRAADLEPDAIIEAVLYFSADSEARTWVPLVFSLSLEAVKGFRVQEGRKSLWLTHPIEGIQDVVPDVYLGGPAFFKLLTFRETLRLRAESPEVARSWRVLIRAALDSYLESGDDEGSDEPAIVGPQVGGNIHRLVQHRLKGDGVLLAHLCTVPSEKGLDAQNFKCAGCPKKIGLSMGRSRLCEFSGQHYCDSCHHGDTTIIPSRMVHNWDLMPREVSRKALSLLAQIEQEPLLNLEQLNPELVEHAELMAQTHNLRQRLRLLGNYLLTCRSGACKKVQARMEQRTYLLESSRLYSVLDLRQVAEGQYTTFLNMLVQLASTHVQNCDLCTQRGFICQICNTSDIIFPFQFDSTTRCRDCNAVFHLACKTRSTSCPRCLRYKKYLERDLED